MRVQLDKESIKKLFPNLAKELENDDNKIPINSIRTNASTEGKSHAGTPIHYNPDVIDFIRRCDTNEQAEEIIAYMEKKGEIQQPYAKRLREQLGGRGVRSFGPKKEEGYYLNHGEL